MPAVKRASPEARPTGAWLPWFASASEAIAGVTGGTDSLFPRLCAVIGRPDLSADERFRDAPGRKAAIEELEAAVSAWTEARTIAEASEALGGAGIPSGPVAEIADAVASPQIEARDMLVEIEHPSLGPLVVLGLPVKLSATPGSVRKAPPTVGEDTDRIYGAVLGLSPAEIAELRATGAI